VTIQLQQANFEFSINLESKDLNMKLVLSGISVIDKAGALVPKGRGVNTDNNKPSPTWQRPPPHRLS
jgi:hypothetical protein